MESLRRMWAHAQGFPGPDASPLSRGWIRSLGGVDPYLALRARDPALTRQDVDAALVSEQIQVVPGVRNCIWVVPRSDVSLALRVSATQRRKGQIRELDKLGVPLTELQGLGDQVLAALEGGPLSPTDLRAALPEGAARSLGAAGKSKGHNSSLPTALRLLEWDGRVVRRQAQLDSNTYVWQLPTVDPLALGDSPTDPLDQAVALAERFFSWSGPATLAEFVAWSSLGKRVSAKAVAALALPKRDVDGDVHFGHGHDPGPSAKIALLPAQDNLVTLRLKPARLANPAHHDVPLVTMGPKPATLGSSKWMFHRFVVVDGQWLGLWDWDPDAQAVCHRLFDPLPDHADDLLAELDAVQGFIVDQLGAQAPSNSIDSVSRQRKRVALVRA